MPSIIPLDNTLGALLIGVLASAIIYGITILQIYKYFSEFSEKDSLYLRLFVTILWFTDTLHLALIARALYFYVITSFGDFFDILKVHWSMIIQVPVGGIVAICVQGFFARRIYILSKSRALPICIIICILALAEMAMLIIVAYKAFHLKVIAETYKQTPPLMAAVSLELACNMIITCAMVFYLWQGRSGLKKTNSILKKLMFYCIESGFLIAAAAAVLAGVFIYDPNHLIYTPFFFVIIRLYPCTFVTTLNTRKSVRAKLNSDGTTTISLGGLRADVTRSGASIHGGSNGSHPHTISAFQFAAPPSQGTVIFVDSVHKLEV